MRIFTFHNHVVHGVHKRDVPVEISHSGYTIDDHGIGHPLVTLVCDPVVLVQFCVSQVGVIPSILGVEGVIFVLLPVYVRGAQNGNQLSFRVIFQGVREDQVFGRIHFHAVFEESYLRLGKIVSFFTIQRVLAIFQLSPVEVIPDVE